MSKELLNRLIAGESLSSDEAAALMARMMDEELTPVQLAGYMVALRCKGESPEEVVGFARMMRARARAIEVEGPLADTCGTGGDNRGTFNISTAAALILAACGQRVAKHGNRGASSRCGSADVLEAVGVDVALPPEGVARCIEEAGMGFLFAPAFHPAMKFAGLPRRELGVRTVFNLLGPLTNPAMPRFQLLGVSQAGLLDLMANSLLQLEVERALVVHSVDGLDEISVAGPTEVREVADGRVTAYWIEPEQFGVVRSEPDAMRGGDVDTNATMLHEVLSGRPGPARDASVINAAAALYVAGRASDFRSGAEQAAHALDSRAAARTLDRLASVSQQARAEAAA